MLIVGLGAVGFIDDYLGVRRGRNLGLRKRGKTFGIVAVAAGFALARTALRRHVDALVVHAPASTSISGRRLGRVGDLRHPRTANAVNITDGIDGLAAGSATFVFAAFMIIAFWQFRHPTVYGRWG